MRPMFWKRTGREPVEAGRVYRRIRADNTIETATVLAVNDDQLGIPHVSYRLAVGRGDKVLDRDARILSLVAFAAQYREQHAS